MSADIAARIARAREDMISEVPDPDPLLTALLDMAEAGARLQSAYSPDGLMSQKLPAWDALDAALARLAEVLP